MLSENNLPKSYDASVVEAKWLHRWSDEQLFTPQAQKSLPKNNPPQKAYVIIMPPPNVTGALHNGHALFVTLQDILARFHRMKGENVLWLPGTDHAGIATQTVVERELFKTQKKSKHDLGREKFIAKIWEWKEKHGSQIIDQLKLMGASADWSRCRFTMDESCVLAVNTAFVQLWEEGLIYRGERLVNWDPAGQTALSDEEVDHENRKGELWKFAYKLKSDDSQEIVVATTRVETMLGDTAVAVHPSDERYQHLIGQELQHPFFSDRKICVIADHKVDQEFGTGAVKITPAHDPADFDMGRRHQLAMISIFNKDGSVNKNGGVYESLDRKVAREQIKKDLTALGLYRGAEEIEHAVSVSQRSHADIEPMLSRQYFVRAQKLAEAANNAVKTGDLKIMPGHYAKTWSHFLDNIQDWCVSRQLWWGHQIPVYYHLEKMFAAIKDDAEKQGYSTQALLYLNRYESNTATPSLPAVSINDLLAVALDDLSEDLVRSFSVASVTPPEDFSAEKYIQENDVLDTWFSSGLWPFSTLGWPNKSDDLAAFYPSAVLETGSDILFFWVARMVMLGIHFMGEVPFKDVFLHALVRDAHGQKMSKSLGNAIDPVDVIKGISLSELLEKTKSYPVPPHLLNKVLSGLEKDYAEGIPASGADGLRLSLAILSGQGQDVRLAIPRVAGYRAFLNKIWNATRFVLMNADEKAASHQWRKSDCSLSDRWILSLLQKTVKKVDDALQNYRFSEAADLIYHFFWTDVCDWYIELVKKNLTSEEESTQKLTTQGVLLEVLDTSMRLFHPFCPFISEEIWQILPSTKKWREQDIHFCAVAPYPAAKTEFIDDEAEKTINLVQQCVTMIRNVRQESGLAPRKKVSVIILAENENLQLLNSCSAMLSDLACLESIAFHKRGEFSLPADVASNLSPNVDVAIVLEGLIDVAAEKERTEKDMRKVMQDIEGLSQRLSNEAFVAKAPKNIVEQQQLLLAQLQEKKVRLEESLARLMK